MYDVFISYSTENQETVEIVRQRLEEAGVTCWFAPKEIRGHQDFTEEIPKAIRSCKAFLLLMSPGAQASKWVRRELGEADDANLPIYTLFLQDMKLDDRFLFVLRFSQRYDASQGLQNQLGRLVQDLNELLGRQQPQELLPVTPPAPKPVNRKLVNWISIVSVVVVLLAIAAIFLLKPAPKDGKYVLWVSGFNVALSPETAENAYYLAGEQVVVKNGKLVDHDPGCVWLLTFHDENTFSISRDGEKLGAIPNHNGIGLGGDHTENLWELVEQGDGTYRIRKAGSDYYLQWYADKNNWVIHNKITAANEAQFAIHISPVGLETMVMELFR